MIKAKAKEAITSLAKGVASVSANTCSILYFYQPECPKLLVEDEMIE